MKKLLAGLLGTLAPVVLQLAVAAAQKQIDKWSRSTADG